jgi:hypothetical protein
MEQIINFKRMKKINIFSCFGGGEKHSETV